MRIISLALFAVVMLLGVAGAGCAATPKAEAAIPTEALIKDTPVEPEEPAVKEPVVPQNRVIKIEVTDWGWSPDEITIKAGETVTLEVTNTGRMAHGVWIPQLGINESVRSGKTILINIEAPAEPTELSIKCNDPMCGTMDQHAGMAALLTVTN